MTAVISRPSVRRREGSRLARAFMVVATLEAFTWAGLLVGMFLKYVTETTEAGVFVFGRLHGAAFIAYLVVTVITAYSFRWSLKITALALLASVPPLATLPLERWLVRRGSLTRTFPAGE